MSANHIIERAKERYGVDITAADVTAMARQISNGGSVLLGRHQDGSEVHLCRLDRIDVCFQAVWIPWKPMISTILPSNAKRKKFGSDKGRAARCPTA